MSKKKDKARREAVAAHTRSQLIAVAVQKKVLTFKEAQALTKDELVEKLFRVEGLLSPEEVA